MDKRPAQPTIKFPRVSKLGIFFLSIFKPVINYGAIYPFSFKYALPLVFLICLSPHFIFAQISKIDSLQEELKTTDKDDLIDVTNLIGIELERLEFKEAKKQAEESVDIVKKYHPEWKDAIAAVYVQLAYVYSNWNLKYAVQYLLESARLYKETNQLRLYGVTLANVALFQHRSNNLDIALHYYNKVMELPVDSLDNRTRINCHNGIALIFRTKKEYIKAEKEFNIALDIAKQTNDIAWMGILKGNIGTIYDLKREYGKAIPYYLENANLIRNTGEIENLVETYNKLGNIYLNINDYGLSQQYFDSSLVAIKLQYQLFRPYADAYKGLSKLNAKMKNFENAYTYHTLYKLYEDSIEKSLIRNELLGIQSEFDFKQKESQIELLEKENERDEIIKDSFFWGLVFASSAILLLTILIFVLFYTGLQKNKTNRILNMQKNELLRKNEEIEAQNEEMEIQKKHLLIANDEITDSKEALEVKSEELEASLERMRELDRFKDGLTEMIVHDLKNPLGTILGLSEKPESLQAAKQMLNMVMNILDVQKLENAAYSLTITDCNLKTIFDEALEQIKSMSIRKSIKIENLIPSESTVKADFEMMLRVFANLLTNAIKYTPNNGQIKIWVEEMSTMCKIYVKDTGVGIEKDKHSLIFDKFTQVNPKDFGSVRSTGLGLAFCKMSVEAHGGSIGVISDLDEGATFWFTLPKSNLMILSNEENKPTSIRIDQPLKLTSLEIENLKDYLAKLKKLSVYEYSDVKTILAIINPKDSQNIALWKQEMENALKACNEEKFIALLQTNGLHDN